MIKILKTYALIGAIPFGFLMSCNPQKVEVIPPAPASVSAVAETIKGKEFTSVKAGFYDNLTEDGKTDVNWIDTTKEENDITKEAVRKEIDVRFHFVNDTLVKINKEGKAYEGTYSLTDKTDAFFKEDPGIKLKISFVDPDSDFAKFDSKITYTYNVLGASPESLLLQTPRTINRLKLLALYKVKAQ